MIGIAIAAFLLLQQPPVVTYDCRVEVQDVVGYYAACSDGQGVYFTHEHIAAPVAEGDRITAVFSAADPVEGILFVIGNPPE